jgi:hypothetical protein
MREALTTVIATSEMNMARRQRGKSVFWGIGGRTVRRRKASGVGGERKT